jgi:hypothetical protein
MGEFSPLFRRAPHRISGAAPQYPSYHALMNELRLEIPRLNPLPFIVADVVLIGAAVAIGWSTPAPIGPVALAAIALCVATGAVALLYPFVVNHSRRQDEALQERTDQIEALARSVAASAEQISIAVANLPAIAENSARQLRAAEQLPTALEEHVVGLQQRLSATAADENASLREALDALRSEQTGRLSSALEALERATADLTRLEKPSTPQASALDQAAAQLPRLADAFGQKAAEVLRAETAAATSALQSSASEAARSLATAAEEARKSFERSVREALALLPTPSATQTPPPSADPRETSPAKPAATRGRSRAAAAAIPAAAPTPAAPEPASEAQAQAVTLLPEPEPEAPRAAALAPTLDPIDDSALDEPAGTPEPPTPSTTTEAEPEIGAEPPVPAAESAESTEFSAPAEAGQTAPAEAALSHDGYTRLVATAYIGIGNKLFIRGDGPGLRRDKGVPLQFVSIGKWRWESAELLFPVTVRLYKNDQVECVALGEITLEPGHHHEVTANF